MKDDLVYSHAEKYIKHNAQRRYYKRIFSARDDREKRVIQKKANDL